MTWQVSLALTGNLQAFLDAEAKAGKRSVYGVINRRKTSLKNNLRKQVKNATKSDGLVNTIRDWINKERDFNENVSAYVFSNAIYKRPGGRIDLITQLDKGEVVRAGSGRAISIPLAAAGKGRGVKHDPVSRKPSDWPTGTFQLIPTKKSGTALLVFKSGEKKGQAAFLLVKQARHKKRINIDRAYQKAVRNIDQLIAKTWERESLKAVRKYDVRV